MCRGRALGARVGECMSEARVGGHTSWAHEVKTQKSVDHRQGQTASTRGAARRSPAWAAVGQAYIWAAGVQTPRAGGWQTLSADVQQDAALLRAVGSTRVRSESRHAMNGKGRWPHDAAATGVPGPRVGSSAGLRGRSALQELGRTGMGHGRSRRSDTSVRF